MNFVISDANRRWGEKKATETWLVKSMYKKFEYGTFEWSRCSSLENQELGGHSNNTCELLRFKTLISMVLEVKSRVWEKDLALKDKFLYISSQNSKHIDLKKLNSLKKTKWLSAVKVSRIIWKAPWLLF